MEKVERIISSQLGSIKDFCEFAEHIDSITKFKNSVVQLNFLIIN